MELCAADGLCQDRSVQQLFGTGSNGGLGCTSGRFSFPERWCRWISTWCFARPPRTLTSSSNMTNSQGFWTRAGDRFREGFRTVLLLLIGMYRTVGTTHLGGGCRFEPSCSEYAVEAVRTHHPFRAIRLIAIRLSKCQPWGPWGFDPVPPQTEEKKNASQQR